MRIATALIILVGAIGFIVGHTMFRASAFDPRPFPECRGDLNDDNVINFPGDVILLSKVTNGLATLTIGNGQCVPLTPIPTWTATPTRTPTSTPTATPTATNTPVVQLRDKYVQPFAQNSIWNMPIGSGATRVAVSFHVPSWGTFQDEDVWINTPAQPLTDVYSSSDAWTHGLTNGRCVPDGGVLTQAPLPSSFTLPGSNGNDTPNFAAAVVMPNGNDIKQMQPLTHCTTGSLWTIFDLKSPDQSLYGDGRLGAHGGSGLSSIGGAVRLGELVQGGKIPHAMQWIVSDEDFNCAGGCYRWPASQSDCGQSSSCYPNTGSVGVKPGSLLALRTSVNCQAAMQTEAGRIVCDAMRDYGGYIVDAGWDPFYFGIEIGPAGRVDDQFESQFGFPLSAQNVGPWAEDVHYIFQHLDLIDNNDATHIGGGGVPVVPTAAPIGN